MIENEKLIKRIFIILLAVCISVAGAMIWSNKGYEEGGLLQVGSVYSFPKEVLVAGLGNCSYDEENESYYVQDVAVEFYIEAVAGNVKWNYCTLKLSKLNMVPMVWNLELVNGEGKSIYVGEHNVRDGVNNLKISAKGDVRYIKVSIYNQVGASFHIDDIKLRQKYFDFEDFLEKVVILLLLCVIAYILFCAGRHLSWYIIVEFLQECYVWLGDWLGSKQKQGVNEKVRKVLQILCFTVMYLLMIGMNIVSSEAYDSAGQYWIFGFGMLLIVAGMLFWEKPLKKQNWRHGFGLSWLLLWGVVSLSDLLVIKSFAYVGYVMVLCGGFAFFIWHNENCFSRVWYCMMKGLEWTLPPILVYCMIFRQKKVGVFYNGCFTQHESMAMYSLALLIAFLAEWNLLFGQKKLYCSKLVVCGLGAAISCFLVYYSRTKGCVMAVVVVLLVWGGMQIYHLIRHHRKVKELFVTGTLVGICALCSVTMVKSAVKMLPERLGTNIIYENEVQETNVPVQLWDAMELQQPGWLNGVVADDELSRELIWHTYMQKLNLIGNTDNLVEFRYIEESASDNGESQEKAEKVTIIETYQNPGNGILQIAHRYGIFVLVPYLMILALCVYHAVKERRFLWLVVVLAYIIVMFWENLEMPFTQPLWLMFYVGMGRMLMTGDRGALEE